MRMLAISCTLLILAACETTGTARSAGNPADAAAATAAWVAAYNTRDPARITALYDPDAVLWGTISPTVRRGTERIADYFKDAGKRPDARVAIVAQETRSYGDMAINTGTYTFSDVREGKPTTSPARFSFVFRQREGRWWIVDHHSSRIPAP